MTELDRIRQEFAARMLAQGGPQPSPQMSPVPDQQGQMSPENMAVLRGQAAYDPGKREAILADQLRSGRDQVFAQGPQGKMMGNIYAAPSWSENLSGAVKKGLGGLEMATARKGLDEVDGLRGVAADATGRLGEIDQEKADAQLATENAQRMATHDLAERVLTQRTENDAATLALSAAENVSDSEKDSRDRKYIGFIDPKNPEKKVVIRQGDDVPEGMMLTDDYAASLAAENGPGAIGKPAAKAVQDYTKSLSLGRSIDGLGAMYTNFNDEQKAMVNSPNKDIVLGLVDNYGPEGLQRKMEEGMFSDKPVLEYRIKANKLEGDISKLMAGLTVTGFEMKDRKKWSPMAEGITQEQRQSRLNEINGVVNNDQRMFEKLYPAYNLRDGEGEEKTIVKTGKTKDGRKVIMYSDGSQEIR